MNLEILLKKWSLSIFFVLSFLYIYKSNINSEFYELKSSSIIFPFFEGQNFPKITHKIKDKLNITSRTVENIPHVGIIDINLTYVSAQVPEEIRLFPILKNSTELVNSNIEAYYNGQKRNVASIFVHYDMYTAYKGYAYSETTSYMGYKSCHLRYLNEGIVKGSYDTLISVFHQFNFFYGHIYMDVVSVIVMIPQQLREKSYLVINQDWLIYREIFADLGFSNDRIVYLKDGEFAHAKILYTLMPGNCIDFLGQAIYQVRNFFHKKYHLERIEPFRFIIYNRDKKIRFIENYDQLMNAASSAYPMIKWEKFQDRIHFNDTVIGYSEIKYLYTLSGSGLSNMIFMHRGTSFSEVVMNHTNLCFSGLSQICGIYHLIVSMPGYFHFQKEPFHLNIDLFLYSIQKGLEPLHLEIDKKKYGKIKESNEYITKTFQKSFS